MMELPRPVAEAMDRLEAAGFDCFVVGGAVRDSLLGTGAVQDWDLTTSARPDQVRAVFTGCPVVCTGLRFGTLTVQMAGLPLEITTYRVDVGASDHRRPDGVRFAGSLREDLERRDFTINALAFHPRRGVVDLVGGLEDLERGLIRCVGEPDRRFQEDGLRLLRALRFASRLEMEVEAGTAAAIHRNRALLAHVSAERIREELTGLLCGAGVRPVLEAYRDVLSAALPALDPMGGELWRRTAAVVEGVPPDPALRWAALLRGGERTAPVSGAVLDHLRFSAAGRRQILALTGCSLRPIPPERVPLRRLLSQWGREAVQGLLHLRRAELLAEPERCEAEWRAWGKAARQVERLLAEGACLTLRDLAVDGRDLLALGLRGPAVGEALRACLEEVLAERTPNEREALLAWVKGSIPAER